MSTYIWTIVIRWIPTAARTKSTYCQKIYAQGKKLVSKQAIKKGFKASTTKNPLATYFKIPTSRMWPGKWNWRIGIIQSGTNPARLHVTRILGLKTKNNI